MLLTRIATFLCAAVFLAVGGIAGASLIGGDKDFAGVAVLIAIFLLCGVCGALSVFAWKGREQARAAAAIATSIYLAIGLLVLVVNVGVAFSAKPKDQYDAFTTLLGVTALNAFLLTYCALLQRLRRMAPGKESHRSKTGLVWYIIGMVFLGGAGGLSGFMVIRENFQRMMVAKQPPSPPRRPESLVQIPEFNYQVKSPGGKWTKAEKGAFSKEASLVLANSADDQYFLVISEELGENSGFDLTTYIATIKSKVSEGMESFEAGTLEPINVGGTPGMFMAAKARAKGTDLQYYYWFTIRAGVAYQLVTGGALAHATAIESSARDFLSRFSFIDPNWTLASARRSLATKQLAPEYGLTLNLEESGWYPQKTSGAEGETARFTAQSGSALAFEVSPINLGEANLTDDVVTNGLLGLLDFTFPGEQIAKTGDSETDGVRVAKFSAEREVGGVRYAYRIRILRRGPIACLAVAWQHASNPDRDVLEQILDRVSLGDIGPATTRQSPASRDGKFWNNAGLALYRAERFDDAAQCFRRAAEANPKDPVFVNNTAQALQEQNKFAEAAAFMKDRLGLTPTEATLARYAESLEKSGDPAGAIEAYGRMFDIPAARQRALNARNALLITSKRLDEADSDLDKYKSLGPNRTLHAKVLRARDRVDEAAALLREGLDADPIDTAAGEDFIELCDELNRYTDIIDASERLSKSGYRTAYTLYHKGSAEFSLDRLPAARNSLEEAQKLVPSDKTVKELLQRVQTRLGQGDPTLFKDPIDAVPMPPEVLEGASPMTTDAGVLFHHRVICYKFEPGKQLLQTVYYRFTILNRQGIDAISSFEFEFDPEYERMFVNKLEVRGEDDQVVFSGSLPNYFISSDSSTELASQSVNLHVPLSALAPGRTVELVVTRRERTSADQLPFRRTFLTSGYATERAAVVIDTPDGQFAYRMFNDVRLVKLPGATAFLADHRPDWPSEPMNAPSWKMLPLVVFGDRKSDWPALGREYLGKIAERLTIPDSVRSLARSLIGDQTDPAAVVRTIAAYVQKEYGYRAIAFGPRAEIPTPTSDIVAARFGDCKDHSLLFVQLLQSLDIPANLVLISSGSPVTEDIPSLLQFNHMIAQVPSLGLFVDLTDKYTDPLLQPPYALNGHFALVLDPAGPSLQRLPDYPKPSGICEIDREIESSGRDLLVTEKVTLSGLTAAWLRDSVQVPQNKLVDQLAGLYSSLGAELTEVTTSGAEDTSKPLEVATKYRVPGALTDVGGHTAVTLPYALARRWYLFRRVEHRETPAEVSYGTVCRDTTRLKLGPGTKLVRPESLDWSMSSPPASASRTIVPTDDAIVIRATITVNEGFYSPDEYNQCASVTNEALTAFERDIVVTRSTTPK